MTRRISHPITVLLCAVLVGTPPVFAAGSENLLHNAGFEQDLGSAAGGWILFDQSRRSSDQARAGTSSMFNWGFSRVVPSPPFLRGTVAGSYQELAASPGSKWRLTGYAMTPTKLEGVPAYGILQLSFFDAEGNDLGTVETAGKERHKAQTSNQVNARSPAGQWIFLDTGPATAPAGTARIHAFTLFVDYSGSGISQGVYFDDLKLCAGDVVASDESTCE